MSKKKNKQKNQDANQVGFLLFTIIIFIIIIVGSVFSDWDKINENRKLVKEYELYKSELLEEEASLKSEVVKLQDPEYVARYAREKYMYTKDGETILRIVDGKLVETKISKEIETDK